MGLSQSDSFMVMERSTRQRTAIMAAFQDARRPLLPAEVLALAIQHSPKLGIATVYRNLKAMVDEGVIKAVLLPGESPRFELKEHQHHHHHFQCKACNRVYDIDACPGNLSRLAPKGFRVDDHELTLYGRCIECNDKDAAVSSATADLAKAQ